MFTIRRRSDANCAESIKAAGGGFQLHNFFEGFIVDMIKLCHVN